MRPLFLCLLMLSFISCKKPVQPRNTAPKADKPPMEAPQFSADSAYRYIQKQVDFGARVPNTKAHANCAQFLSEKLARFGAEVTVQKADLKAFDGTTLHAQNIIGSFAPEAPVRLMLFAHWDTRPWADHDPNPAHFSTPILGANDGASGVGVLLEVARQLGKQLPEVGVDILFFDAEDYGAPEKMANQENADSWCLGSQYWAKNKHTPNYRAKYGILLDMVGAADAKFYREQISDYYAKHVVDKVWSAAASLRFSRFFIDQPGNGVTDDHLYVNRLGGIPSIDIIHQELNSSIGFGAFWHTTGDTMDKIDKQTLHAVGTTLLHVIYSEKP